MSVFERPDFDQHEHVSFFHDEQTGLKAIIAVHNTHLGPALGGCRMWDYAEEADALTDVLRLSKGMTYKSAIAGLPLGGGKSVIIGNARTQKTPALMKAMGRAVETLGGRYIVAEDVGMNEQDMCEINKETSYVVGLPQEGEKRTGGNPSPITAYGVFLGLQASVRHRMGREDLNGLTVAVQGLGNVGYHLSRYLKEAGAKLYVTDVREENVRRAVEGLGATAVDPDKIVDVEADVFAPCALGAILNDETIDRLKASVVAGAANNQLAEPRHGDKLRERNVLYAPDYVINAGGVIAVYYEYLARQGMQNGTYERQMEHVERIAAHLESIFHSAEKANLSTNLAADRLAMQKVYTASSVTASSAVA